jgi:hypothetical protein
MNCTNHNSTQAIRQQIEEEAKRVAEQIAHGAQDAGKQKSFAIAIPHGETPQAAPAD